MKKLTPYVVALGVYLCLIANLIDTAIVDGDSMSPTIKSGQEVWGVRTENFKTNDIVLATVELKDGEIITMVKRVYGVEGDEIDITGTEVRVNDELVKILDHNTGEGHFILGTGEYFLLGDNPKTVWVRTFTENIKSRMEGFR